MSATGKCGHCGYEPVAIKAKTCPNCHGEEPVLASVPALYLIGALLGGFLFIGLIFWLVFVVFE